MITLKYTGTVILMALTVCADIYSPIQTGQVAPPPGAPGAQAPSIKGDKIEKQMFPDGVAHDFGQAQRGIQLYHAFRIVNTSNRPLRIESIRLSMSAGTLRVWATKEVLQPNEEGNIELEMDTRLFIGLKTLTTYVVIENGGRQEHRIWVQANSCENFAFFPECFDFGKLIRGDVRTKRIIVAIPDQPKLLITEAICANKCVKVRVQELGRGKSTAVYQVSATVHADIPEGELNTYVELPTNNPAMPKLRVPLNVVVESPK